MLWNTYCQLGEYVVDQVLGLTFGRMVFTWGHVDIVLAGCTTRRLWLSLDFPGLCAHGPINDMALLQRRLHQSMTGKVVGELAKLDRVCFFVAVLGDVAVGIGLDERQGREVLAIGRPVLATLGHWREEIDASSI